MTSQIDGAGRSIDVRTPVMLVHRVFLIQVDLEELVVRGTLEVLEPYGSVSIFYLLVSRESMAYVFNFLKFDWTRYSSETSMNASSLPLTGMK